MKNILITLLICIVSPIVALAEIDERKTDIYFANGILTDEGNATANTIMLKNAVKDEFYNGSLIKMQKRIGKVTEAYNSTHGEVADLYESMQQKLSDPDDFNIQEYLPEFLQDAHTRDLTIQVNACSFQVMTCTKACNLLNSTPPNNYLNFSKKKMPQLF